MNSFHRKYFNSPVLLWRSLRINYCFVADTLVSDFTSADAFVSGFIEVTVAFAAFTPDLAWFTAFVFHACTFSAEAFA